MEKILILYVQVLKEKLFIAYMMFVLEALDKFEVIGESFARFTDNFRAAYNHLNQMYLKYDHKFHADAVREANDKRSKAFSRFNNYVRSFLLNTMDAEKTAAAERIVGIIKMYGASDIFSLGFREITTQIVNLIEDLDERLEAEIRIIGAEGLLDELRAAQAEFNETYLARVEYDSEVGSKAMADARKRMTEAYRSLVTIVNENVAFDTEGLYQDFIRVLNVEIRTLFAHTKQHVTTAGSGTGTGSAEGGAVFKTATFRFVDGRAESWPVEVGTVLVAPSNTDGYRWKPTVPEFMPATNRTFNEVPIEGKEVTLTFHFLSHEDEEIRGHVGTELTAPENTDGCHWEPEVPSVFPEEDMTFNEVLDENNQGGGAGGSGSNSGSGSGSNTGGSTGSGGSTTEPTYSVATFNFFGGRSEELRQLVGSLLHAPSNTEGYRWVPAVPSTMPSSNTTYNEEAVGAEKYTVAWYLPNGNPIVWYELFPGDPIPEAPEPPEGYYWHPYPDVMPNHDLDIIPEPIKA